MTVDAEGGSPSVVREIPYSGPCMDIDVSSRIQKGRVERPIVTSGETAERNPASEKMIRKRSEMGVCS